MSIEAAGGLYALLLVILALWGYGRQELQKKYDLAISARNAGEVENTTNQKGGAA